mmetsp:Transcript_12971/g.18941  ORF Transcript_12971/g.18941 Transcript_12971/m.18941 type:complete len:158 (-) Transcript_12971:188-661(-)
MSQYQYSSQVFHPQHLYFFDQSQKINNIMNDPVTRKSRQNEKASYIPYGSFQLPFTSKDQSRKIVTPPNSCKRPLDPPSARPLQACPGLPKPNQEMKYFSWKKHKRGSHVNLQKMTYHDHSDANSNENPADNAEAKVNDAEMDATITLTSCLSQANR